MIQQSLKYLLLLLLVGCATTEPSRREQRKMKKTQFFLFTHPEFAAGYCSEQYPVKDQEVKIDTVIKYDTITITYDSLYYVPSEVKGDSLFITVDTTVPVIKSKKVSVKAVVKKTCHDTTIYRRDIAEETKLKLLLERCQSNNNDLAKINVDLTKDVAYWKGKAHSRFWWILLLIGGAATYTVLKFKKSILT